MTYRVTKIMGLLLILYDYCDYYISYVAINIFFLVWSFKKLYVKKNKKWERERERERESSFDREYEEWEWPSSQQFD